MQSIHDSTVPTHFAFNMQPHGLCSCMMEECSADRNQHLARLRAQRHRTQQRRDSPRRSQRLASQRERLARRREQSLLKEGMLAYHITAAITACIIITIPLTRANRLAAMRESDERITSIFHTLPARPPAFYICSNNIIASNHIATRFITCKPNLYRGLQVGCQVVVTSFTFLLCGVKAQSDTQ